jgi:nitrogen fixation/metabolism regulation signal transduction histidine kinase
MTFAAPPNPVPRDSFFAPANRATKEDIESLAHRALSDPILQIVFDAIGGYVMVLDKHRQIVVANDELMELLKADPDSSLIGLRPGEALHCVNSTRGPNGCGTSRQCRHCGAVATILSAQAMGKVADGQCTLSYVRDGTPHLVDFRVRVSPLKLGDTEVYIAVFQDISALKWAELQQRMFLHDLANVAMGLSGWSEVLTTETTTEVATRIVELARQLSENLNSQRLLLQCESGEFHPSLRVLPIETLVTDLKDLFEPLATARNCQFIVNHVHGPSKLRTDGTLLLRVLGNLVKNAFEASPAGKNVTITIQTVDEQTEFVVHNIGTIPERAAQQLFKRRFSTKGQSRGLGIYAVQVFGEQYLGGHVEFESTEESGTFFRFTLPDQPTLTKPAPRE